LGDSARETIRRFRAGHSVEQIAREREVTPATILGHLAEGIERGEPVALERFFSPAELELVRDAFARLGYGSLTAVFEKLGGKIDYGRLRIFRAEAHRPGR